MPRHESSPTSAATVGHEGTGEPGRREPGTGHRWDSIIVAGGRARRLGGIDKTALIWQGRSLLDGVVAAASGSGRTCVVGSEAHLPAGVLRAVERPRWGGPAAAVVAGLAALAGDPGADSDWILVLAADLVRPDAAVAFLLAELDRVTVLSHAGRTDTVLVAVDGLISVDSDGRRQPLLAVYRRAALVASARLRPADNLSVMSLIGGLNLVELPLPGALGDDIDTSADAARLGIVLPVAAPAPASEQPDR